MNATVDPKSMTEAELYDALTSLTPGSPEHRAVASELDLRDSAKWEDQRTAEVTRRNERVQLNARPTGGSAVSNQYGTFRVRHATDKQVRFLRHLMETRVIRDLTERQAHVIATLRTQLPSGTVNLRTASDAIEILLSLPEATQLRAADEVPAYLRPTAKQLSFLGSLLTDRDTAGTVFAAWDQETVRTLTKAEVSKAIDLLMQAPRKPRAAVGAPEVELESGIYLAGGVIYKVYRGQSQRMLAKELKPGTFGEATWEYRGLATRFVTADQRMTLEQAKEYGAIYGVCCNCGATLTDETSIENGIGPICAKRFG